MYSICDVTPPDHLIKEPRGFFKLFRVCYDPDKFVDYRFCENEGLMLLICNVTSRDLNIKELNVFMVKGPSQ